MPVLFLDTFHHFPQTLAYRDELLAKWGLNLINLRAAAPEVGLWQKESTEACCKRHKVERSSPRWTATTPGSQRCVATSRRRART